MTFALLYLVVLLCIVWCFFTVARVLFCFVYVQLAIQQAAHKQTSGDTSAEQHIDNGKSFLKQKISLAISGIFWHQVNVIGKIPSHIVRNFLYRYVLKMKLEKNVVIYHGAEIRNPWNISIGEGTIIGEGSKLDGRKGLQIGKYVNFSTGVWIWTDEHDKDDPQFGSKKSCGPVIVHDRAWLSSRTTILPSCSIGEGAVVAAGAVVTKNVDPYVVVGGVPAKPIGVRTKDLKYSFNGNHLWCV